MRIANLLSGIVAALVWGVFLFGGMRLIGMISCANLPDFPIVDELVFRVVIPAAMLALTVASVALANYVPRAGRAIAWFPFASLPFALAYFGFLSGILVSAGASSDCPF